MPVQLPPRSKYGYYHENRVKELFEALDANGNGVVSFAELKEALSKEFIEWERCGLDSAKMTSAIYKEADTNGDNSVDFAEFWKFALKNGKGHSLDPSEAARDYLGENNLVETFETMLAALIFAKPDDPKTFLANYLTALKQSGKRTLDFFTDDDLKTMFGMFDITRTGKISSEQAVAALLSLGVEKPSPVGFAVGVDEFVQIARQALDTSTA